MAYVNLVGTGTLINPVLTFVHFRNFVCKLNNSGVDYSSTGIGWTLVDSDYTGGSESIPVSGNWFVIYSAGEDGLRDLYYKIILQNNSFDIFGYLYWNSTTHAGTCPFGTSGSWVNTLNTNNNLFVYGDLDSVVGITEYGTAYYATNFGWMPDSPINQDITNYPSAISSGTSVTLTFSSVPVDWAVGTKLFCWDQTNIERVCITAISGNDVTFSTASGDSSGGFANSYSGGADFSMERTDFISGSNASSYFYLLISHNDTKNGIVAPDNLAITNPTSGDSLTGYYPSKKIFLSSTTAWMGPLKNLRSTLPGFAAKSTHTIGSDTYRHFGIYSNMYMLLKEV